MLLLALPALAETLTFQPGEDWCSAAKAAVPGDTIVLAAGEHAGPCVLSAGGTAVAPVTLRGDDAGGASITYAGSSSNVLDVTASHVWIEDLSFGPTHADIDAIKVKAGDHVQVRGNTFSGVGGISVSANSASTTGLQIVGNAFTDLQATALYLGCHGGAASCVAADVLVAENFVDGVTSSAVGYALEIKADSWGVVRDNVFADAQGPAVEVFGSEDAAATTTVVGNLFLRSRSSATLEVGGPNVVVRNNVVIGGAGAALYVYPYFDAVHDVLIEGNTLYGEAVAALSVHAAATGVLVRDNAAAQDGGGTFAALPAGVDLHANAVCESASECWRDAASGDFRPVEAWRGTGVTTASLSQDFCGLERTDPPTPGAFDDPERGPTALGVAPKAELGCPDLPGGGDETGDDDGGDDTGDPAAPACGCASGGSAGWAAVALLGMVGARRARRDRPDRG